MKVANKKYIRRLSIKSMKAAMVRNVVAVAAIALTTVLFTSLFTIAFSINYSFEQSNFRQVGGNSHGTFKYLTKEQYEEIREDPLIKEYGVRRIAGMPDQEPFTKSHVEVGYSDANQAKYMFIKPVEGRLPEEGTKEAATDTKVLSLLGIEPEIGAEFTMTFNVDGTETTETFTLCGWWEYDEAIVANHVLIPLSRVEEIFEKLGTKGLDGMTGSYNLDVMFQNSAHIERDMQTILSRHGYQNESRAEGDNYIATGENWAYTSTQLADSMDPVTVFAAAALLLLIIFTGYLIIYNVFQISVSNDIRFYGLLKTIGTTGRQIRKMILLQALLLSVVGIPIGLLFGFLVGRMLTPIVLAELDGVVMDAVSFSPLIFIGAAVFSVITVLISCRRPGRIAAKVSPVEAVRYTEGTKIKKSGSKARKGASLPKMAWANLGRNRSKTAVTILSLALAVVLLNVTVMFTDGFDMDKYVSKQISTDFVFADASYFQVTGGLWSGSEDAVSEDVISLLEEQGDILESGRVYGKDSEVKAFITEDYFRQKYSQWNSAEQVEQYLSFQERNAEGLVADDVQLYGMEPFALDQLKVIEGDLSKVYEEGGNEIAAVYMEDDYGNPVMDTNWAKLGDTITLHYIDEVEYYDTDTGEILNPDDIKEGQNYDTRTTKFRDVEYTVAALVMVPYSISYRYFGNDEFIMNDETFIRDTGTEEVMVYAFDTTKEANAQMEAFISQFTNNTMPQYDYQSKLSYAEEFDSFRRMFLMMGGVLSFIIGMVGVLNFFNAILTGILTRKREFAVLQSIGMTGKQLKIMLIWEGLYYALGSLVLSLLLGIVMGPFAGKVLGGMFWFFTYRFTIVPIVCVTPFFAVLGVVVPLIMYHVIAKNSIVERLRETE